MFASFCCFFIDGKEGERLKWTSETTTISFLRNVFWLIAFWVFFFKICLTNLNGLGAKFADSLIKFGPESENYSSCVRVSDLKPFNILGLRFAKNCRKMYPDEKRTCTERIKCFTFCPCYCGCWNYFVYKEPWPCSQEKFRIKQFGLWEWISQRFCRSGIISTNCCFEIWMLLLFKRNSFK